MSIKGFTISTLILSAATARAGDISFKAFGTVGYSLLLDATEGEKYNPASATDQTAPTWIPGKVESYDGIDKKGTFARDARFGLNVSSKLDEKVDFTAQIYTEGVGQQTAENRYYKTVLSLFGLTFKPTDNLRIFVGKRPVKNWLISDERLVSFTYPWIRPPGELYHITSSGESLSGALISYQLYFGETIVRPFISFGRFANSELSGASKLESDYASKIVGVEVENGSSTFFGRYQRDVGNVTFFVPYTEHSTTAGADYTIQVPIEFRNESYFSSVGYKYDSPDGPFLMGEYTKVDLDLYSDDLWIDKMKSKFNSGYATLGYNVGKFLPRVTYGFFRKTEAYNKDRANERLVDPILEASVPGYGTFPEDVKESIREPVREAVYKNFKASNNGNSVQRSINVGLNYNSSPSIIYKFEFQRAIAPDSNDATGGINGLYRGSRVDLFQVAVDFVK